MKIFVVGFPYDINLEGECFDLIRIWRMNGLSVVVLPVAPLAHKTIDTLTALGCTLSFNLVNQNCVRVCDIADIQGQIVVALYCGVFFQFIHPFRIMGCKTIWMGPPFVSASEADTYGTWGPCDRIVVQSLYHKYHIMKQLQGFGYDLDQIRLIRTPIVDDIEFNIVPHCPGKPLVVGKLGCAADRSYYSSSMWDMLASARTNVRAIVGQWSSGLESAIGRPIWAEATDKPNNVLSRAHCLMQVSSHKESWSRFGLEAMAHGVPVIAQNDSGWKEMIRHGDNGLLCNSPNEVVDCIDLLCEDENFRIEMAIRGREALIELASVNDCWKKWEQIFLELR